MKTKNIESLESIADRIAPPFVGMGGVEDHYGFLNALLADPTILDHIPAVKALREELELERQSRDADAIFAETQRDVIYAQEQKISDLESQLAEMRANSDLLRQGGEAVGWRPKINFQTDFTAGEPSKATVEYWREQGVDIEYAYLRPQPAIPPGYARVPLIPTRAMEEVVNQDEWQWEDLLAAAEAITEDQYNEIASAPAIQPQAESVTVAETWQPIETASAKLLPPTGCAISDRVLIAYDDFDGDEVVGKLVSVGRLRRGGRGDATTEYWDSPSFDEIYEPPTHWMPLPAAPKEQGK